MIEGIALVAIFISFFFLSYSVDFTSFLKKRIANPMIYGLIISGIVLIIFRILFVAFFSFVMFLSIFYYIKERRERQRRDAMRREFILALNGMAESLKSGLSIIRALEEVSKTCSGEVGNIFERFLKRVRDGVPLSEAIMDCHEGNELKEWRLFKAVIRSASRSGGGLSRVLTSLAETMNETRKLRERADVLTASQRFQGVLMLFIPFFALIITFFIEPDLIINFLSSREGFFISTTALILQVSASYIIWRMTG